MKITDYFEVVSTNDRVVYVRLKGFWTDALVAQISTQFLKQFNEAVDSMRGKRFLTLADLTELKPPSEKTKESIAQAMRYAKDHNLYKTVEVMPSAVTRIAVRQAAEETGNDDFRVVVSSVDDGWAEISKMKRFL
ncbi:MAG: hypothetical protein WCF99_02970 [Chloroflexales bacterium]